MTLDADDVEAIARRVAELVGHVSRLVDAHTVAAELQVERDWVYAHANELGAVRLGNGSKARLRFDMRHVRARVAELARNVEPAEPARRRTRTRPAAAGVKLTQGRSSR